MTTQQSSAILALLPSQANANTQPLSSLPPSPPSCFTARTPSQTPFLNEKRSDIYPPSPSPALPHPTYTPSPALPRPTYTSSPALPPSTYTTAPPKIATASTIYAYKSTDARGLHMLPGDRICVTEYIDTSWAQGRNARTGAKGMFPRDCVRLLDKADATAAPRIATASAIYEYKPTDAGGLPFLPEDCIRVTEYIDAYWAKGRNESTGAEGIFPRNFARFLDELYDATEYTNTDRAKGWNERTGVEGMFRRRCSVVDENGIIFSSPPQFPSPPPAPSNHENMPSGVSQGNSEDVGAAEGTEIEFNQNGKNFGKKLGNAGERIGLRLMMNSPVALQSTCSICLEDRARNDFPKVGITSSCAHPLTDICNECIRRFISSELSQRGTAALSCPICRQRMSHHDVYRSAAREDFDRYDERAAIEAMESDPLFRWCPNAGCGAGQIQVLGDAEPKAICIQCHEPYCFVHRVRWHRGLSCSQFDETPELAEQMRAEEEAEARTQKIRSARGLAAVMAMKNEAKERRQRVAEERLGEAFVKNNSKQCPGCKWSTQRTDGCRHMTCMLKTE